VSTTPREEPTEAPQMTGIVLRVPEADRLAPYAHITLLAPFGGENGPTEAELADVEEFFADIAPIRVRLAGESRFPDGVRYLCPEPAATFRRLTHDLHALFPEYPPYRGEFSQVVPHLTLPDDAPAFDDAIDITVRAAVLLRYADGAYQVLQTFPFGTSAA